jgi:oligopeptide transport system substrate-binding protein
VRDFTHSASKLVFSLNLANIKLMSKPKKCMQQPTEIAGFATRIGLGKLTRLGILLLCGITFVELALLTGCGDKGQTELQAGASRSTANTPNQERVLRRGIPGEPRTLDPQLADDTFSFPVLRDLYEGLTAEDRGGNIVPGAAESWTVDESAMVYTFALRRDAKWSNGDRTVASEFVEGLRRAVDPQTASGSSALLAVIKGASDIIAGRRNASDLGVSAVGENLVRVELEHPAPFVLQILAQPVAAPVHRSKVSNGKRSQADQMIVSNGPYSFVRRITGSFIELAKNSNYWDASNVLIARVQYVNVESEATEIREYEAGQIEITSTIPAPDLDRIKQIYGAEMQSAPILGTLYLGLDLTEAPFLDNRELRQALSIAVDRELISEHVTIGVVPAYSFVAMGIPGYRPPAYQWSTWTRERQLAYARSLFSRSGYSEKKPLHLTLYFNSGESIQRIMIAIANSWKKNLGIATDLVSEEFRIFLAGRKNHHRWDVARLGWYADYADPASFLDVFSNTNSQNDPGYSSTEFNNLINAARTESNPTRRIQLLQESEKILLNDYPIIPIYFYTARRLVKPYLGGAEISPLNHTYSKHLFWRGPL